MAHDLAAAVERVSRRYFRGVPHPRAGWGKPKRLARRPRGYVCAHYDPDTVRIWMHPALKDPSTPRYVIDYLVFHEMLHFLYGCKHGPRLRAHDKSHPDYQRVDDWLSKHIGPLAWQIGRRNGKAQGQ